MMMLSPITIIEFLKIYKVVVQDSVNCFKKIDEVAVQDSVIILVVAYVAQTH